MKTPKPYWIKERDNFQSAPYFVACGQLSKTAAMRKEKTLSGINTMHRFDTEAAYLARLAELKASGERVS